MKLLLVTLFFCASSLANTGGLVIVNPTEKDYVNETCQGKTHAKLSKTIQIDCLTETHAIEYDKASNWSEALEQIVYKSATTNKKLGIVLTSVGDDKYYLSRLHKSLELHNLQVDVWCYSLGRLVDCDVL